MLEIYSYDITLGDGNEVTEAYITLSDNSKIDITSLVDINNVDEFIDSIPNGITCEELLDRLMVDAL